MSDRAGERTRGRVPNEFEWLMLLASVLMIASVIMPR